MSSSKSTPAVNVKLESAAAASKSAPPTDADEESLPIWFNEEERWELTWPIWHMLPRDERKTIAFKHGYKTIGDFEEYMSLQRSITDSATASRPYANNLVYPEYHPSGEEKHKEEKVQAKTTIVEEDLDSEDEELEEAIRTQQEAAQERLSTEELMNVGGKILMLPDELLHKVFAWLPVDTYATLAVVSPHWKAFTRTEAVYRRLCERLYLVQSQRKALHVHRFNNSYRTMLEKRPRVRAGGGVYVMKYTKVKPIQRDMWTEVGELRACFSLRVSGLTLPKLCLSLFVRFLLELFWKWCIIDTFTFKKMAEFCMHSRLQGRTKCFVACARCASTRPHTRIQPLCGVPIQCKRTM